MEQKQIKVILYFNEVIDNSNFISSENIQDKKKQTGSIFGKVGSFFEKKATEIGKRINEMKIGEKSKIVIDKTAVYLDKKSKDVIVI